jgi:YfiH family protein
MTEPHPEHLTAPSLAIPHGFFTRRGGTSAGPYASLNCSLSSGDDPDRIAANRARVAASLILPPDRLLGVTQIHGTEVALAEAPWPAGQGPRADAIVTRTPGLGLGIITADCAPILFADPTAGVIAAAHAGWRGALAGIIEATVAAMTDLGANPSRIAAAIGPCIGPDSYEVGDDMRTTVLSADPSATICFHPGHRPAHHRFDLPAYCRERAFRAGLQTIDTIDADTLPDETRFFSHRRRTLAGGGPIGHQISVIRL